MTPKQITSIFRQEATPVELVTIELHNPSDAFRGVIAHGWWLGSAADAQIRVQRLQRDMVALDRPNSEHSLSATEVRTKKLKAAGQDALRALFEAASYEQRVARLLLAAAPGYLAHPDWESPKGKALMQTLRRMAGEGNPQYHGNTRSAFPVDVDEPKVTNQPAAWVRYLSRVVGKFTQEHVAVRLMAVDTTPLYQRIAEEASSQAQKRAEADAAQQEAIASICVEDDGSIWKGLSNPELMTAVWNDPVSIISQRLGVSDVAVTKRCKKLGIPTPPRGFWAQVHAGKRPHPKGKPDAAAITAHQVKPVNSREIAAPRLLPDPG